MNNVRVILILLRVIDKLINYIETLDTEGKLTADLKSTTNDLSEALKNAVTPTQEETNAITNP